MNGRIGQLWRYMNRRELRPRLPKAYMLHGERPIQSLDERTLIAWRSARTPTNAQELLKRYGSVDEVLKHAPPPQRKAPPRFRRLWRFIRYWFP